MLMFRYTNYYYKIKNKTDGFKLGNRCLSTKLVSYFMMALNTFSERRSSFSIIQTWHEKKVSFLNIVVLSNILYIRVKNKMNNTLELNRTLPIGSIGELNNIEQRIKRKAIENGLLFKSSKKQKQLEMPQNQCGFHMSLIPVPELKCFTHVDDRATVSLALVNKKSSILEAYANKLPIMVINVSRLLYTTSAFVLRNRNVSSMSATQQALEFYVKTDLKHRKTSLPPNQQFSQFLHRLKSSGYTDYIFDLARETNLNIDYILDSRVAARYIKVAGEPGKEYSSETGYLTVIHESDNKWYVKTTKTPILPQQMFL